MIGEMLLGILISFAIWAIIAGIMYWLTADVDITFCTTFFLGFVANLAVGAFLSGNVQGSYYSFGGACLVALLLGLFIWLLVWRFDNAELIAFVCAIVILIGSYCGFWYLHLCNTDQDPYSRNIVKIEEPVVKQYRYELLGGSDATKVSGTITGSLHLIRGSVSEGDYYKVYYAKQDKNGEMIAVPITISEKATTVVLMPETEA